MDSKLKRYGLSGYNKPKRTPSHKTKSHMVMAKVGDKTKLIRFGQQGVSGSPKKSGESSSYRKRRESFKARHSKNIAKGKMSAAWWADRVKWLVALLALPASLLSSEPTTVTLAWNPPKEGDTVTGYILYTRTDLTTEQSVDSTKQIPTNWFKLTTTPTNGWKITQRLGPVTNTSITITQTTFFTLTATNQIGESPFSEGVWCPAKPSTPQISIKLP
jgi:hypothetical protein